MGYRKGFIDNCRGICGK